MTSQQIQSRALRGEQVERFLATDMTLKEWCGLNQVSKSTMYRWMSRFRREEPGLFADPTHGEWIELSRGLIVGRTALAVRATDEEPGPKPKRMEEDAAHAGVSAVALVVRANGADVVVHRGRVGGAPCHGAEGGGLALNPFTTPDRILISRRPQDMRAGIQRLAAIVATDFGMDPTDGALYCFV